MQTPVLLTTPELADLLRLKPSSIAAALCRRGEVAGVRPIKIGRMVRWPLAEVQAAIAGAPRAGREPQS